MKATGHNSFRTSIQWSRLIPEGVGAVNPQAVDFYNSFIAVLILLLPSSINLQKNDLSFYRKQAVVL